MINNNHHLPLTFTAHRVPIRDGEWVCHIINEQFPHFSTSKFKPLFQKKLRYFCGSKLIPQKPMTIHEILYDTAVITKSHKEKDKAGFIKKFIQRIAKPFLPKHTERDYQIIEKIRDKIEELGEKRVECILSFGEDNNIFSALKLLKEDFLGNCFENAVVAELILKLNGIKNARTLFIKNGKEAEHTVCAFNIDGSELKNIINNKTIIIDPWAQKADFAHNMIIYLKNHFGNNFILKDKNKLEYEVHEYVNLSQIDLKELKKQYPALIFNSKNHEFMKK